MKNSERITMIRVKLLNYYLGQIKKETDIYNSIKDCKIDEVKEKIKGKKKVKS